MSAFKQILSGQSFRFLLDLEIKKARTYRPYLSLLSFTFGHLDPSPAENPNISLKTIANLLKNELKNTDIVCQAGGNRLLVMLPCADMAGAHKVRARLEKTLHYYGFGRKGFAIEIDETCFPTHTTKVDDLLRIACPPQVKDTR